ncbi:MAG: ribosome recycling factor [Candidatus Omnitrophica bacterium]|nr:ribosome recycling factor [Candidatus Omnitrophota bacterium]
MNAQQLLKDTEDKMKRTADVVSKEFLTIRTGRASSALVEGIKVDYYGTPTPLKQLATITTPDPKLLVIQPWDVSVLPEIEKAILKSDLGLNPTNDGKLMRIGIPQLTKERREELVKIVRKVAEEGRVSIRSIRRDSNESLKKFQKDGLISEDDAHKFQDTVQKLTDKYISNIDHILKSKESEITEG